MNATTTYPTPKTLLEQLLADIEEQKILSAMLKDLVEQRADDLVIVEVASLSECLKNKWGGILPSQWLADARKEIADFAKSGSIAASVKITSNESTKTTSA